MHCIVKVSFLEIYLYSMSKEGKMRIWPVLHTSTTWLKGQGYAKGNNSVPLLCHRKIEKEILKKARSMNILRWKCVIA